MRIRLTKIRELPDAENPKGIPEGFAKEGYLSEAPKEGQCFWMQYGRDVDSWFRSSLVIKVIDEHTFRTKNSIYTFEFL